MTTISVGGALATLTGRRVQAELAGLAEKAATEAEQLLANARRALRRAQARAGELAAVGIQDAAAGRRLRRAVNDLTDLLAATRRIVAQTRQRLSGTTPDGATRRVSLHDAGARPIAKGPRRFVLIRSPSSSTMNSLR